jgi:hypothetical protein
LTSIFLKINIINDRFYGDGGSGVAVRVGVIVKVGVFDTSGVFVAVGSGVEVGATTPETV